MLGFGALSERAISEIEVATLQLAAVLQGEGFIVVDATSTMFGPNTLAGEGFLTAESVHQPTGGATFGGSGSLIAVPSSSSQKNLAVTIIMS